MVPLSQRAGRTNGRSPSRGLAQCGLSSGVEGWGLGAGWGGSCVRPSAAFFREWGRLGNFSYLRSESKLGLCCRFGLEKWVWILGRGVPTVGTSASATPTVSGSSTPYFVCPTGGPYTTSRTRDPPAAQQRMRGKRESPVLAPPPRGERPGRLLPSGGC